MKSIHLGDETIDGVRISTINLKMNGLAGLPDCIETMIFGGEFDGYQQRYETVGEAIEGHRLAVEMVKAKTKGDIE